MTVIVSYSLEVGRDQFLGEDALTRGPVAIERLLRRDYLYGRLLLTATGQPDVYLEDEFPPLLAFACLQAPIVVTAYGEFYTAINRYPGDYAFETNGTDLRLSGDAVIGLSGSDAAFVAPKAAFLAALFDGGRRALAVLHALFDGDPSKVSELAGLDELAAETAEAMAASGA